MHDKILVLDFGSQYTQLIARRVRELKVYCEIHPFSLGIEQIRAFDPKGIILSGGPSSVYDPDAPLLDPSLFDLGRPILGICYGLQLMAHLLGGKVAPSRRREYGPASLRVLDFSSLFFGLEGQPLMVWMSHGDRVEGLPPDFLPIAESENAPLAAIADISRHIYGIQFHPEVAHTPRGKDVLRNFVVRISGASPSWDMRSFHTQSVERLSHQLKGEKVVLGVSGGIDSTVTAALLKEAVGDGLHCIFVDNGLLRKGEAEEVGHLFREGLKVNLIEVDARERFLNRLRGVRDPEEKRRRIGREFIRVFEETAARVEGVGYLAQGTLYPDVIESRRVVGPSATIKSHHNVGGLPKRMRLKLVEPLKELFKDEVRELALELGLPPKVVRRQPFPGPGLAVRVLGEVTEERLAILREADAIVQEEVERSGLAPEVWQAFAVLLPMKSVGVKGDARSYEHVIALRVVESKDGMTADWVRLPYDLLNRIATRIMNEVAGVNRVVYDVSPKPPSTIEWE